MRYVPPKPNATVWLLAANVINDHALRTDAKVLILNINLNQGGPFVRGLNKSGRIVHKYIRWNRLENFRPAMCPPKVLTNVWLKTCWSSKQAAAEVALGAQEIWRNSRRCSPDGNVVEHQGRSTGQATKDWEEFLANPRRPQMIVRPY